MKKIFAFIKMCEKQKQHSAIVLQWAVIEAACTLNGKSGTAKLLPQEIHSASWHQAAVALNCVFKHLCFISIYFVYSLARYVLR